jgi:hypothetical protein
MLSLPGETVRITGVYDFLHFGHRPPHQVFLWQHEMFPRCRQCGSNVIFKLLRRARKISAYRNPEWSISSGDKSAKIQIFRHFIRSFQKACITAISTIADRSTPSSCTPKLHSTFQRWRQWLQVRTCFGERVLVTAFIRRPVVCCERRRASAKYVGAMQDLAVTWTPDRHTTVQILGAHYEAGSFLEQTVVPGRNIGYVSAKISLPLLAGGRILAGLTGAPAALNCGRITSYSEVSGQTETGDLSLLNSLSVPRSPHAGWGWSVVNVHGPHLARRSPPRVWGWSVQRILQ